MTGVECRPKTRGFTLIEVLVALAVFAVVTVTVAEIFLLAGRATRRLTDEERLAGEARVAVEYLARLVRTGSIAYDLTPPVSNPISQLALRGRSGTVYNVRRVNDASLCGATGISCLFVEEQGVGAALTSRQVNLTDLKFFLAPAQNPFVRDPVSGAYPADIEPRLTVSLTLAAAAAPSKTLTVQTTISSRQYER